MVVVASGVPEVIRVVAGIRNKESLIELCLECDKWQLVWNVSERVFQLSCNFVNAT